MDKDSRIAAGLKARRNELKMTAAEVIDALVAAGFRISAKTLYGWENGVSTPKVAIFLKLCDIYQIGDILGFFSSGPGKE